MSIDVTWTRAVPVTGKLIPLCGLVSEHGAIAVSLPVADGWSYPGDIWRWIDLSRELNRRDKGEWRVDFGHVGAVHVAIRWWRRP